MTLTQQQLSLLKDNLLTMKKNLENQASIEDTQIIDHDEEIFTDNHLADAATASVDRQTQIAESNLNDDQLNEVVEALNRMKAGTYGICVDTKKEIPFERLMAIPYAKRTVEAEENHHRPSPANQSEDTTRLVKPKGKIADERNRTLEKIEEEHD